MDKLERIKELVELLNKAGKSYYSEGQEIMSNYEYDALYDELKKLEEETGCVLSNSPTVNVGYEVLSELPKERHDSPMLSLDKTKDMLSSLMKEEEIPQVAALEQVCFSEPWTEQGLRESFARPEYLFVTATEGAHI